MPSISFAQTRHELESNNYSLTNTSAWNLKINGLYASGSVWVSSVVADIDNNGLNDLLLSNGYTCMGHYNAGAVIIVNDKILSNNSKTKVINLSDNDNYTRLICGANESNPLASNGDSFGETIIIKDIDNNGKNDLIVNAFNTDYNGGNSGSVYIIYDWLLGNYSEKEINIIDKNNFNIRIDGFSKFSLEIAMEDINNNKKNDLLVSSNESFTYSSAGAVYIFNDNIFSSQNIGKVLNTNSSNTYSIRFDGQGINKNLGMRYVKTYDLNNNGINDLLLYSYDSHFTILDNLIAKQLGQNNNLPLDIASSYSNKFVTPVQYNDIISPIDIDQNGKIDIILSAPADRNNGRNSGSVYIILNQELVGSGERINIKDKEIYYYRIDGVYGYSDSEISNDFDYDGYPDIILQNSEGLFFLSNKDTLKSSKLGNVIDINNTKYNFKIMTLSNSQAPYSESFGDINNDGRDDFIFGEYSSDGQMIGSWWIIYNYPHIIIPQSPKVTIDGNSVTLSGNILAPDSIANIHGIDYSIDSVDFYGEWFPCDAKDGSFDSTAEDYQCDLSGLASGKHTVYFRSYDQNILYTKKPYPTVELTVQQNKVLGIVANGHIHSIITNRRIRQGFFIGAVLLVGYLAFNRNQERKKLKITKE